MIKMQRCILHSTFTKSSLKLVCNPFYSQKMLKSFNLRQRSILSQKFLAKNENLFKKRKKEITSKNPSSISSTSFSSPNVANTSFRINRLNTIFMDKISEALMSSQYAFQLIKLGFEIAQTKVQPNLSSIHVYWYCTQDSINVEDLDELLVNLSNDLRFELTTQYILGKIPPIIFVKDETFYYISEIDRRLKIADFGPDETTEDSEDSFNIDASLPIVRKDSDETQNCSDSLSKSVELSDDARSDFPNDVIKIQQSVLGVDREKILKDVVRKCKESKGLHRHTEEHVTPSYTFHNADQDRTEDPHLPNFPTHSRLMNIKKWAAQFKKERKSHTKKENYSEQENILEEEWKEDSIHGVEDEFDENIYEEEDYDPRIDNKFK